MKVYPEQHNINPHINHPSFQTRPLIQPHVPYQQRTPSQQHILTQQNIHVPQPIPIQHQIPRQQFIPQGNIIYSPHPPLQPTKVYNQSFIPMSPGYIIQPVPVIRRHPQADLNMNFDYQSANFLCEQKIEQNSVHCVICGLEYKVNQKQKHLERHQLKKKFQQIPVSSSYRPPEKKYKTKPIVQPQQCIIRPQPIVYNFDMRVDYKDPQIYVKQQSIGQSLPLNNSRISSGGNTLNSPSPFITNQNPFSRNSAFMRERQQSMANSRNVFSTQNLNKKPQNIKQQLPIQK